MSWSLLYYSFRFSFSVKQWICFWSRQIYLVISPKRYFFALRSRIEAGTLTVFVCNWSELTICIYMNNITVSFEIQTVFKKNGWHYTGRKLNRQVKCSWLFWWTDQKRSDIYGMRLSTLWFSVQESQNLKRRRVFKHSERNGKLKYNK